MKSSEIRIEMSTLKVLKEYLVGNGGYLLDKGNNGKTVMLSGAWGSGKTHFWQNEIEDDLTKELNEKSKACVYVSLYGKDNIEAIKNEILFKAYESIKDENKLAKRAISAFGFGSRLLSVSVGGVRANTGAVGDAVESFFESKKIDEAESFLADGGLVCLDDFERKSKHIDLNDLFGFIAQLAIDMNCKIVIILNSDVFEGEEANVFKTVKEKTVNKFFHFEPSIEELFESIYTSDDKYNRLDEYKSEILRAIKETEELNARIYIQVLDNCLEWTTHDFSEGLRALVLNTICFVKYNFMLSYYSIHESREANTNQFNQHINYEEINYTTHTTIKMTHLYCLDNGELIKEKNIPNINIIKYLEHHAVSKIFEQERQRTYLKEIYDNEEKIRIIFQYGYELFVAREITKTKYEEITNYIQTGIFIKNNEDSSS